MRVAPSIIYIIFVGLRKWFLDKYQTISAKKRAPAAALAGTLASKLAYNDGAMPVCKCTIFCRDCQIVTRCRRRRGRRRWRVGGFPARLPCSRPPPLERRAFMSSISAGVRVTVSQVSQLGVCLFITDTRIFPAFHLIIDVCTYPMHTQFFTVCINTYDIICILCRFTILTI